MVLFATCTSKPLLSFSDAVVHSTTTSAPFLTALKLASSTGSELVLPDFSASVNKLNVENGADVMVPVLAVASYVELLLPILVHWLLPFVLAITMVLGSVILS